MWCHHNAFTCSEAISQSVAVADAENSPARPAYNMLEIHKVAAWQASLALDLLFYASLTIVQSKTIGGRSYLVARVRERGLSHHKAARILALTFEEMQQEIKRRREVEFPQGMLNKLRRLSRTDLPGGRPRHTVECRTTNHPGRYSDRAGRNTMKKGAGHVGPRLFIPRYLELSPDGNLASSSPTEIRADSARYESKAR